MLTDSGWHRLLKWITLELIFSQGSISCNFLNSLIYFPPYLKCPLWPPRVVVSPFSLPPSSSTLLPVCLTAQREMLAKHPLLTELGKNGGQALNPHQKQTHVTKRGKHPRIHRATCPLRLGFSPNPMLSQARRSVLVCSRFANANIYYQVRRASEPPSMLS